MTSDELRAFLSAHGIIALSEAERRWGVKNLRQNSHDRPPRVRLGPRVWVTTEADMRALYGPPLEEQLMAAADEMTDRGRKDPAT